MLYNSLYGVTIGEARSIASVLSHRLKVAIKEGGGWAYSHKEKTIFYRPDDLASLTQVEVIGNLLHETGHAKFTDDPDTSNFHQVIVEHKSKWIYFINAIEDFRIEDKVRAEYPYALDYLPEYSFKTQSILRETEAEFLKRKEKIPRFIQYCWGIYAYIAGITIKIADKQVAKVVSETQEIAQRGRFLDSTQEILDLTCEHIYDKVKPWLDEWNEPSPLRFGIALSVTDRSSHPPYESMYRDVKKYINPTIASLRRVLTDNIFDKYSGKFRTGKLNEAKLYKARVGEFNLFQKRVKASAKDYVFALLVDESGSMDDISSSPSFPEENEDDYSSEFNMVGHYAYGQNGNNIIHAAKGAILFSHVLNKLGIPFGIWGFNHNLRNYKRVGEPFSTKHYPKFEDMLTAVNGDGSGSTCDGWAISEVVKGLRSFGSKKILFVLTDGASGADPQHEPYSLRTEIKKAKNAGINTVGFGIGDLTEVEKFYPDRVIVSDVSRIPQALIKELKHKLK